MAPVIVLLDQSVGLWPESAWSVLVSPQDAVLEGLMPAIDLALGLAMIWGTVEMNNISGKPRALTRARNVNRSYPRVVRTWEGHFA